MNDNQAINLATVGGDNNSDSWLPQDDQPKSPLPSTSAAMNQENIPVRPTTNSAGSWKLLVSPQMIVPVASIATTSKQTKRQCQPTVPTSTPYELQLEESMKQKRKAASIRKRVRKKTRTVKAKKIKKRGSSSGIQILKLY